MSTGLISNLLSIQPQTSTPAADGSKMLPREYIMRNPDNKIYVVGDIDKLKEDIRLHGSVSRLRSFGGPTATSSSAASGA